MVESRLLERFDHARLKLDELREAEKRREEGKAVLAAAQAAYDQSEDPSGGGGGGGGGGGISAGLGTAASGPADATEGQIRIMRDCAGTLQVSEP